MVASIRRALAECSASSPWMSVTEIRERVEGYAMAFEYSTVHSAENSVRWALNSRLGPHSDFVSKKGDQTLHGRVYYALRKNVQGEHWVVHYTYDALSTALRVLIL